MGSRPYVMTDNPLELEQVRLAALELIFDPGTQRILSACRDVTGARCLEVGPGAGSIAKWLADAAGARGEVVAVDIAPDLIVDKRGLTVVEGDIQTVRLDGFFDLIHARAVIEHTPEPERLLRSLTRLLRPGGSIVVEALIMPGENLVAPDDPAGAPRKAVHDVMLKMGLAAGIDFHFGYRVPWLLQSCGLEVTTTEIWGTMFPGGDSRSDFYRISLSHLHDFFLSSGAVSEADLDAYVGSTENAAHFQMSPLLLTVVARQRPPSRQLG